MSGWKHHLFVQTHELTDGTLRSRAIKSEIAVKLTKQLLYHIQYTTIWEKGN